MALAKQITEIRLENAEFLSGNDAGGTEYTLAVYNMQFTHEPVYFNDTAYDTALSGKLRNNFRGYRIFVSMEWDTSTTPGRFKNLFDDLSIAFVGQGEESISFYPDANETDNFEVVLDGNTYRTVFESTVGIFKPELNFAALNIGTVVPSYMTAP